MLGDRREAVAAAIRGLARADAAPIAIEHVCRACRAMLGVDGVSMSTVGTFGVGVPVYATDPVSDRAVELEVTVGRGPGMDAIEDGEPVLLDDLTSRCRLEQWPVLVPLLVSAGVRAAFAFPLTVDEITVGVLELYREHPGALSSTGLTDARLFAEYAMTLLLDHDRSAHGLDALLAGPLQTQWARVHQAVGVVAVQLRVDPVRAYQRLRAHAFATDRHLRDVAADVLDGLITFRW